MAAYSIQALQDAGFELVHYKDRSGDFWAKQTSVGEMGDPRRFIGQDITEDDDILIEWCVDTGVVQWFIAAHDAHAEFLADSPEANRLLSQAGVEI